MLQGKEARHSNLAFFGLRHQHHYAMMLATTHCLCAALPLRGNTDSGLFFLSKVAYHFIALALSYISPNISQFYLQVVSLMYVHNNFYMSDRKGE